MASSCPLARVDGRGLDFAAFQARYREKEPVLLSGLLETWPARARWGGGGFARIYGKKPVLLDNGDDGQWRAVAVADYLGAAPGEPLGRMIAFSFSDYRMLNAIGADITAAVARPEGSEGPSPGNWTPAPLSSLSKEPIFSLARGFTGAVIHQHEENWVAQVVGRKAFMLAAPSTRLPTGLNNRGTPPCALLVALNASAGVEVSVRDPALTSLVREAEREAAALALPAAFRRPGIVCVALPGETLYLPSRWWHATCNLDDPTVAVGGRGDASARPPLHARVLNCWHLGAASLRDELLLRARSGPHYSGGRPREVEEESEVDDGARPMHLAALAGCRPAVEVLTEIGAEVDAQDGGGRGVRPLHSGAVEGYLTVVEWLAARGGAEIHAEDGEGKRPLHYSVQNVGHLAVAEWLTDRGAEVHAQDSRGRRPLHYSAQTVGHLAAAVYLAVRGAEVHAQDGGGMRPFHYGAIDGHLAVAEWLAARGAEIHAQDDKGYQPLHFGAAHGHLAIAEWLAARRAEVHASDSRGRRPFHYGVIGGHIAVVECLAARGADVGAHDSAGRRPYHYSAQHGKRRHRAVAEWLAAREAEVQHEL